MAEASYFLDAHELEIIENTHSIFLILGLSGQSVETPSSVICHQPSPPQGSYSSLEKKNVR